MANRLLCACAQTKYEMTPGGDSVFRHCPQCGRAWRATPHGGVDYWVIVSEDPMPDDAASLPEIPDYSAAQQR